MRQQIDHVFAVAHATGVNLLPQHDLGIGIVHAVIEFECCLLLGLLDRPPGEAARHFGDIFLGVPTIDAQRVQLHQLAAVIFVQPARVFLLLLRHRRGRPGLPVAAPARLLAHSSFGCGAVRGSRVRAKEIVEIKQHRRTLGRRGQ